MKSYSNVTVVEEDATQPRSTRSTRTTTRTHAPATDTRLEEAPVARGNVNAAPATLPAASCTNVPGVTGAHGVFNAGEFEWSKDEPVGAQTTRLCSRLAETGELYRIPGSGMFQLQVGRPVKQIQSSKDLDAFIRVRFPVTVIKDGEVKGRSVPPRDLEVLLVSDELMAPLPAVDHVTNVATYNDKWELTRPGYNGGDEGDRYFYTGEAVTPKLDLVCIREFLDAMSFKTEADATNAVALALSAQLRFKFPGQKPFGAVTANKSHAGKDTVLDFAAGRTKRSEVSWSKADWATQNEAVDVLRDADVGMLTLGNIRSAGEISSAFIERIVTEKRPRLQSSRIKGEGVMRDNDFVVTASANRGRFSSDLMNRALPIRLEVIGDIADRKSGIDDPRYGYLPLHRAEIEAEVCGMIEIWKLQGCPLDMETYHPMTTWKCVIGGILKANKFYKFLDNWREMRDCGDNESDSLAIIAHHAQHDMWLRATDIADVAMQQGVVRSLLGADQRETRNAKARNLGISLAAHADETLCWKDAAEPCPVKVRRERLRNGGANAAYHYMFETVQPAQEQAAADVI